MSGYKMTDIKKCTVALKGVSDSERIVFKLICSVSARTKGRDLQYVLLPQDNRDKADILIRSIEATSSSSEKIIPAYSIVLFGAVEDDIKNVSRELSKPLIATRVLTALDDFVDATGLALGNEENEPMLAEDASVKSSADKEKENFNIVDTLSIEITEQEASELAIVHDESLTNPANIDIEMLRDFTSAEITPIRINEKHNTALLDDGVGLNDRGNEVIGARLTPRALVVDDSPSVRKQLELELELFDVDVDYAATANEAMSMLNREDYDIAFLDVVLPDNDGFSICRHIKETAKKTSVIMLTGKAKQADKVKGALAGCDAYMVKPVGRLTFQSTVRNYLTLIDASSVIEM